MALVDLDAAQQQADGYHRASLAPNTLRAYRSDLATFSAWCAAAGVASLPATSDTTAAYLSHLATQGAKTSTVMRAASAIAWAHREAGAEVPTKTQRVAAVRKGIARTHGTAPRRAQPCTPEHLRASLADIDQTTAPGLRDRALLLLGFACALRRSELVALDVADVRFTARGAEVVIRSSKTDQTGQGTTLPVSFGRQPGTCPVAALEAWLGHRGRQAGPLFVRIRRGDNLAQTRLSADAVADIVSSRLGRDYSPHGALRAGGISAAAARGVDAVRIAKVSRHRSLEVLGSYVRAATVGDLAVDMGL